MNTGMVLGKFMPPHVGHKLLVDFSQSFVDELSIVVGSLQSEPIDGESRYRWMKDSFPNSHVFHLTDENPQTPEEHPDFWNIWCSSLLAILERAPEFVFASEHYGKRLAQELGAQFVPVNIDRDIVNINGTACREDIEKNWEFLLPAVQLDLQKKICLIGPESCGKTQLTKNLAQHYNASWVPEYARIYFEAINRQLCYQDMLTIAKGQIALEESISLHRKRLIFCDTDSITTSLWSQKLFTRIDPTIEKLSHANQHDLYLVLKPDVPWVNDPFRYSADGREQFFKLCIDILEKRGLRYAIISGNWEQRFNSATKAIDLFVIQDFL